MTYHAKESKGFWLVLLLFAIANIAFLNERVAYTPYLLVVIIVLGMFLQYELNIKEEILELKIKVFSFTLITRKTDYNNIKEMYFVKLNKKPNVLIKLKKGIRWKIANFAPTTFDQDLFEYGKKYDVKISELNGYKVSEK